MNKSKGILFIISGPSGVGKGTILAEVLKRLDDISVSVSVTTRKPRQGEIDGVSYYFITDEQFDDLIKNDGLYEYVRTLDKAYGTPKQPVIDKLNQGKDVILEIETFGAETIRKTTECVSIFIAPPSMSVLKSRLCERGTETPEQIKKRLDKCVNEIDCIGYYDYVVINDVLSQCAEEVVGIITAERCKTFRNKTEIKTIKDS